MSADAPTTPLFIRERAATRGDALCISLGDQRLSFAEVEARSRRWARALVAAGLGKGSRVGLLAPNGPDWVTAWLAVTRVGGLLVPLYTFYAARELGYVLRHADVDTLLCVDRFLSHDYLARLVQIEPELEKAGPGPLRLPALPYLRRVVVLSDTAELPSWATPFSDLEARAEDVPEELLEAIEADVTPADPMVVIYSSGSTADPKGAVHTHGSLLRHAHRLNGFRDLEASDVLYSPMPFFWVGGFVFSLLCAMDAGAAVLCETHFDPPRTLDLIERERATLVAGWPHYSKALAADPSFRERDLSAVRGGNLYDLLPEDQRPRDPELVANSLGMTETGGPHSIDEMGRELPERLRGSFGHAVPEAEHKIVDPETGARLGADEFGEICVRGASLMQGLYKQEREDVFDRDGFYHTGDGGHLDADGILFFKARLGDLIKTGGANVTPREVELVLEGRPGIREAHVVGLPHPDRGQVVAAALQLEADAEIDLEALRTALRDELSAYKVPRHLAVLDAVPMTDSGKVDKKRLTAQLAERFGDALREEA